METLYKDAAEKRTKRKQQKEKQIKSVRSMKKQRNNENRKYNNGGMYICNIYITKALYSICIDILYLVNII
jgi:regulator of replication initiation timing